MAYVGLPFSFHQVPETSKARAAIAPGFLIWFSLVLFGDFGCGGRI
jgi:hypothetical protein